MAIKPKGPLKVNRKVFQTAAEANVLAAARAYVEADVNIQPGSLNIIVTDIAMPFARVIIGADQSGGYAAILKQVNKLWVVVFTGQDYPSQATGQKYGLPTGWYTADY